MSNRKISHPATEGVRYVSEFHWPRFYRYRVADPHQFSPLWNRYVGEFGTAHIGAAVVIGHYAYCVKWASSHAEGVITAGSGRD